MYTCLGYCAERLKSVRKTENRSTAISAETGVGVIKVPFVNSSIANMSDIALYNVHICHGSPRVHPAY